MLKVEVIVKKGKTAFIFWRLHGYPRVFFFMAIEDYFYVSIISLNGLYKVIILYILYMRLVKHKKLLKLSKKKVIKN